MGNTVDCFSCFDIPGLVITVKTGDTKGGGLHNTAYLTIIDEKGNRSQELCLTGCCVTVFKKGHTDTFKICEPVKIGRFCKIEFVRRDATGRRNYVEWFIETIEIRRYTAGDYEDFIFPCHRWIKNKQPLILRMFDSTLPQFDVETEQRETELFWKRTMYRYYRRRPGIPPQVRHGTLLIKSSLINSQNLILASHGFIYPSLGARPGRKKKLSLSLEIFRGKIPRKLESFRMRSKMILIAQRHCDYLLVKPSAKCFKERNFRSLVSCCLNLLESCHL